MVTNRKNPTAAPADRLLEVYRAEARHWTDREMIDGLLECSPNMLAGTVARCATKLQRPHCGEAAIAKMVEEVIQESVARGYAHDVEAFIRAQAQARAVPSAHERIRAGVERIARRGDVLALEAVADLIDSLIAKRSAA